MARASHASRLKLSVVTSALSKLSSILVLLWALPSAIAALGSDRYGAFAVLTSSVAWVPIAQVGLGPGITSLLAGASAPAHELYRRVFTNGLLIALALASGSVLVLSALQHPVLREIVLGTSQSSFVAESYDTQRILTLLVPLLMLLGSCDAFYNGFQKQYVVNLWAFASSLLAVLGYGLVRGGHAHMPEMAGAMFGSVVISKALSALQLLKTHRDLRFDRGAVDAGLCGSLLREGLNFTLLSAGTFLSLQLTVWTTGRFSLRTAAEAAALVQLSLLLSTGYAMYSTPMWPSLLDGLARRDGSWIRKICRLNILVAVTIAVMLLIVLQISLPAIVRLLYGVSISGSSTVLAFSFFSAALALEHFAIMTNVGLARTGSTARFYIGRSLVSAAVMQGSSSAYGLVGALVSTAIIMVGSAAWLCRDAVFEVKDRFKENLAES